MDYAFKAHETNYNGTRFRSRLEARWAAFLDLVGWEWVYEPVEVQGWLPDFMVKIPCGHSECRGYHVLLAEVKPYYSIRQFDGHPCTNYYWGGGMFDDGGEVGKVLPFDSSACFGIDPNVSYWEMVHGAGGGVEDLSQWVKGDINLLWREAGNRVQYKHEDKR
jgi:hypothetical protein